MGRKRKYDELIGSGDIKLKVDEPSGLRRVPFPKLEHLFITEPVIFGGITLYQKAICKTFNADLMIVTGEGEKGKERLNEILNLPSFKECFLEKAPLHLGIYGNSFIELVWNENQTKFIKFVPADPKWIDFRRGNDNAVLFEQGEIIGYEQINIIDREKPIFTPKTMLHLHINQLQRGEMGIGFIEPCYNDCVLKENVENAKSHNAYRQGYPVPLVKYGTPERKGVGTELKAVAEKLAQDLAKPKTDYAAFPFYLDVDFAQSKMKSAEAELTSMLIYETKLQAAALGLPVEVLLQSRDKGIDELLPFFEASLSGMQNALKIDDTINLILKEEGFDIRIELEWKEFSLHSAREKIMQISRLGKHRLIDISQEGTRDRILKIAGLKGKHT